MTLSLRRCACPILLSLMLAGFTGAATAQDLPSYMAPISGSTSSSAAETATSAQPACNPRARIQ
jgi:hypothetical protein